MDEQAVMWKNDKEKFEHFSKKRDEEKAKIMGLYKENLVEQMALRKNHDKKWRTDMKLTYLIIFFLKI